MVLESIYKSEKRLFEIAEDTSLDSSICLNITFSLVAKNLVLVRDNKYRMNKDLSAPIIAELRNKENMVVEMNTLVRECVKNGVLKSEDTFKFKKVFMNEREKKLLKAMLYNLETFIDGLKSNKGETKEETIIFWGGDSYAKTIHSYIS